MTTRGPNPNHHGPDQDQHGTGLDRHAAGRCAHGPDPDRHRAGRDQHDLLIYKGDDAFATGTLPFVRQGLARDENVVVAVTPARIRLLRAALGPDAGRVTFEDMTVLGANPTRILPAWGGFAADSAAAGRPCRGLCEPAWPGRDPAALGESHLNELLVEQALGRGEPWRLRCLYDCETLTPRVISDALRSHPAFLDDGVSVPNPGYGGSRAYAAAFTTALPEPAAPAPSVPFGREDLPQVRAAVTEFARAHGLSAEAAADLELAAHEIAMNSLRHGGGRGELRLWSGDGAITCEVRDGGRLADPLTGRRRPVLDDLGGRGLWLANQLCDLVQIRAPAPGTAVRLHRRLPPPAR